jgi:hypothetical protein
MMTCRPTVVAREQLCGHVVTPGNEKKRNNVRDVSCAVRAKATSLVEPIQSCSCEKMVAKDGDSPGTQKNVRRWKPVPNNG